MTFAVKPARLAAPSSTFPRFPTEIMVIVVRQYSRSRERAIGVAFLVIAFASVAIVVVIVSCIWKACVPVLASPSLPSGCRSL